MCGILGIVAPRGQRPSLDDHAACALRDRMAHRGPDAAGLWRHENCLLAHRRLSVIDPSPAGAQPMVAHDDHARPHVALVYNGELYNDAALRTELTHNHHARFASTCDTETILHAWRHLGPRTLPKLRAMFALGVWNARTHTLTLARDPLGVKPLYYARTTRGEIVFASDPGAVAAHPDVGARPNWRMVSAYLTTIRTVLGDQTMFEGVHSVRPGEAIEFDCSRATITTRHWTHWTAPTLDPESAWDDERAAEAVRAAIEDSTLAHLRADVPTCALLSGGLDSSALVSIARRHKPDLRTYCAGAREGAGAEDDDLDVARRTAAFLATGHEEAVVTRASFAERWPWMVRRLGVPLSTPNEAAIHEVAARLRDDGCVVTLSGEGADELFAGYDMTLRSALAYRAASARGEDHRSPGRFELESNAWITPALMPGILRDEPLAAAESDRWLPVWYDDEFAAAAHAIPDDSPEGALNAHLRFTRRVNLTGLLQRLDTATMLSSVEGRVPYADAQVASLAESMPMSVKLRALAEVGVAPKDGRPTAPVLGGEVAWETKSCLRRAFAQSLPAEVINRPKRSFPLPFREWIEDGAGILDQSPFAREVFRDEAIALVQARPRELWNLAWPMINIALWGSTLA